jgi:hypothetical protein
VKRSVVDDRCHKKWKKGREAGNEGKGAYDEFVRK